MSASVPPVPAPCRGSLAPRCGGRKSIKSPSASAAPRGGPFGGTASCGSITLRTCGSEVGVACLGHRVTVAAGFGDLLLVFGPDAPCEGIATHLVLTVTFKEETVQPVHLHEAESSVSFSPSPFLVLRGLRGQALPCFCVRGPLSPTLRRPPGGKRPLRPPRCPGWSLCHESFPPRGAQLVSTFSPRGLAGFPYGLRGVQRPPRSQSGVSDSGAAGSLCWSGEGREGAERGRWGAARPPGGMSAHFGQSLSEVALAVDLRKRPLGRRKE